MEKRQCQGGASSLRRGQTFPDFLLSLLSSRWYGEKEVRNSPRNEGWLSEWVGKYSIPSFQQQTSFEVPLWLPPSAVRSCCTSSTSSASPAATSLQVAVPRCGWTNNMFWKPKQPFPGWGAEREGASVRSILTRVSALGEPEVERPKSVLWYQQRGCCCNIFYIGCSIQVRKRNSTIATLGSVAKYT